MRPVTKPHHKYFGRRKSPKADLFTGWVFKLAYFLVVAFSVLWLAAIGLALAVVVSGGLSWIFYKFVG